MCFLKLFILMKTCLLVDYLASSLAAIEGRYPGCDFNSLNINQLMAQFRLKQLVWVPTRGQQTLDLHCNYYQHASIVQQRTCTKLSLHLICLTIRWFYWSPNRDVCSTPAVFVLLLKGTHILVVNANSAGTWAPLTGLHLFSRPTVTASSSFFVT